jgi:hypothetical protein
MAKSTNLNFTQNLKLSGVKILPADTTTLKTLFTAGTDDSVVKAINVQSTDTAARIVYLYVNDGVNATDFMIGSVNIPLRSGDTGLVASIDLLGGTLLPSLPYDANGKRILPLPAGYILKVSLQTGAVTTDKAITFVCMAENY